MNPLAEVSCDTHFLETLTAELQHDEQLFLSVYNSEMRLTKQVGISGGQIYDALTNAALEGNANFFITPNSFILRKSRSSRKLSAFHAIVVDINFDGQKEGSKQAVQLLTSAEGGAHPNAVVWTGEGVQMWWMIHRRNASEDVIQRWEQAAKALADKTTQLLNAAGIQGMSVNTKASTRLLGEFRLPGSMNPRANQRVDARLYRKDRYDLEDLLLLSSPQGRALLGSGNKPCDIPTRTMIEWSEKMLKNIETLRNNRGVRAGREFRNDFCLIYLCLLMNLPLSVSEIAQRISDFNQGFQKPLTADELRRSLNSAWKKKCAYSSDKIVEFLKISEDEAKMLDIPFPPKAPSPKSHDTQNEEIIRLYQDGKRIIDIAAQVGVHRNTVSKIIKNNASPNRKERIIQLYRSGLSVEEIAQKEGCTVRNVNMATQSLRAAETSASQEILHTSPTTESQEEAPLSLHPAISLLRENLKSRYGAGMSDDEFDQHFKPLLKGYELVPYPTLEAVQAEFSKTLTPGQDEMYRFYLGL